MSRAETCAEYIERKGTPDVLLALSIMRQVASALQRASEMGIIHRDIKPENILLNRKGEVKVADFGLSRVLDGDRPAVNLTQSGVTMGTPLYMSPEQVEGKPVDCRTDIYSFGITAYHMLAGYPPFRGSTAFEVAVAHVQKEPEPLAAIRPDLPAALCGIIHKMLAKDPEQRYPNGRELIKDLVRLRESLSGQTLALLPVTTGDGPLAVPTATNSFGPLSASNPSSSAPVRTQPYVPSRGRRWLAVLVVLSVVLAAAGGATYGWWRAQSNVRPMAPVTPAEGQPDRRQQREQALRQAAEQYINPTDGYQNARTGLGICLDLGLFYLDNDRLEDAEQFFTRLEGIKQVKAYHNLGRLGRGIVLALRSDPKESNRLFREFFKDVRFVPDPKVPKGPNKVPADLEAELFHKRPDARLERNVPGPKDSSEQLRFWLIEALVYNQKNGSPLERNVLPPALQRLYGK